MLDAPWVEDGKFTRVVGPADGHPLAALTKGGPSRRPQVIETKGTLGQAGPYAIDTIAPPFENPWNALLFFGDHDFLPDGSAMICTIQGDVWHVTGLDATLEHVRWRRFATGLHHALGLVVSGGQVYALGRDQITRLVDLDGDGEADFHECVSNAYLTSPAGHDFICGLQRDGEGRFYTVSGKQGFIRVSSPTAGGSRPSPPASGTPTASASAPTARSPSRAPKATGPPPRSIAEVRPGGHYGYGGPRRGARRPTCLSSICPEASTTRAAARSSPPATGSARSGTTGSTPRSAPGPISSCSATGSAISPRGPWSRCPASSPPAPIAPG